MAAKTYSAGTIFLQVVPVFGDTMNSITREAKKANQAWGDEAEKGGKEAGERAGKAQGEAQEKAAKESGKRAGDNYAGAFQEKIKGATRGIQRELDTLQFSTLSDDAERRFKQIKALAKDLDVEITPDMNTKKVQAKLDFLRFELRDFLERGKHELRISENIEEVIGKVEAGAKVIDKAIDRRRVIEIETKISDRDLGAFEKKFKASTKRAAEALGNSMNPEIQKLRARLDGLNDSEIGIDISADAARAELISIDQALSRLPDEVDVDIAVNTAVASAELLALRTALNAIDGRDIDIPINVKGAAAATATVAATAASMSFLQRAFSSGAGGADSAANSFRSFNFVVLAAVTLLPAMVPILGAVGGGLLALLPILASVAGGLGVLGVGFSGISDAVGALGGVQDAVAKDTLAAGKTMSGAADNVADAERALGEARRSAGQAAEDAGRAVSRAKQAAADAIESALEQQRAAQRDYRDSVAEVARAERDLAQARRDAAYELRDLNNSVSQNNIDIGQATIGLAEKTSSYNATMANGSSTNQDKMGAQLDLDQANLRLKELREQQQMLATEKAAADKNGVDSTDTVKNAQTDLLDALSAQKDAQLAVGKAAKDVRDVQVRAAQDVADAQRNLARTQASGARAVADAQRNLARAQRGYADAVTKTGEVGSASMQKLDLAMSKLGPTGQKFARFLFSLREDFYATRDAIQEALLPPVQRAIQKMLKTYGPQLRNFAVNMAGTIGGGFDSLADRLTTSPVWQEFFAMMDKVGPALLSNTGKAGLNFLEAFANIMTLVAPYSVTLSEALVRISEATANWVSSAKGTDTIRDFMDYAKMVAPDVLAFFESLWKAFIAIAIAVAPWGDMVLKGLTAAFDYIAGVDPKTLSLLANSILTLGIAFQIAVGAVALFFGGMAVLSSPASSFIFYAILMAGALASLYQNSQTFRDMVGSLTEFLKDHSTEIQDVIKYIGLAIVLYKTWKTLMAVGRGAMIAYTFAFTAQTAAVEANTRAAKIGMAVNKVYFALMKGWTFITKVMTLSNLALAASFLANPIVLIVIAVIALVAVLVLLFKKNKTFHDAVMKLWGVLKVAGVAVWNALKTGFKIAMEFIVSFWRSTLKPALEAIARIAIYLWKNVFMPAFQGIWSVVKMAFSAIVFYWTKILWPVLDLIMTVVWKLFTLYFKVYFNLIKLAVITAFTLIKLYWNTLLKPALSAMGDAIAWLWDKYVKPNLPKISAAFDSVKNKIKNAWENFIEPAIDAFQDAMGSLSDKVNLAVDLIKLAWDKLKQLLAAPIYFFLDTIINDGLIGGFNKVAGFVGSTPMGTIPIPDSIKQLAGKSESKASGGILGRRTPGYADGGVLPGYSPNIDNHTFVSASGARLNLAGGEAIMRPEFTSEVGPNWVDDMNLAARSGGRAGVRRALGGQSFKKGGIFYPLPGGHIENTAYNTGHNGVDINVGSGEDDNGMPFYSATSGTVTSTGYNRGYGNAVFVASPYGELVYGHSLDGSIRVSPGQGVSPGTPLARVGNTGNSSGSHLHFGYADNGTFGGAMALLSGAAVGKAGAKGKAATQGNYPDFIKTIVTNPLNWAKSLISGPLEKMSQFGDNPYVRTLTEMPGKLLGKVASKVMDIIPGVGLFSATGKFVGKGISAVTDALGGGDSGGEGGEGSFASGGVLPYNGTMKYDSGGYLPPGITSVVNMTGKPEPVFTSNQLDKMQGRDGMDSSGEHFTYAPTFHKSDLTAADVVRDMDQARRKMRREGRYARIRP